MATLRNLAAAAARRLSRLPEEVRMAEAGARRR